MNIIQFDLPINGIKVKNLEELRDNLTDEILTLARSSQLERWLRTRQLLTQADAVVRVVQDERTDKSLFLALCKVLEVEVHPDDLKAIFDAPPALGRFISGARYFELYEELKNSLEKKKDINKNVLSSLDKMMRFAGAFSGLPIENIGFGGISTSKEIKNVKFVPDLLNVYKISEFLRNGNSGCIKNVFVKQGSAVLKGSLIAEIGFRSSVIRIHAPVAGVVEEVSVEVGRDITIGDHVCAIAEKQA